MVTKKKAIQFATDLGWTAKDAKRAYEMLPLFKTTMHLAPNLNVGEIQQTVKIGKSSNINIKLNAVQFA